MTTHKKRPLKSIIEELEEQGYQVEIEHYRKEEVHHENLGYVTRRYSPRGGTTRAIIIKDDSVVAWADAFCSDEDNYNRKLGALISLGRAKKNLEQDDLITTTKKFFEQVS